MLLLLISCTVINSVKTQKACIALSWYTPLFFKSMLLTVLQYHITFYLLSHLESEPCVLCSESETKLTSLWILSEFPRWTSNDTCSVLDEKGAITWLLKCLDKPGNVICTPFHHASAEPPIWLWVNVITPLDSIVTTVKSTVMFQLFHGVVYSGSVIIFLFFWTPAGYPAGLRLNPLHPLHALV